MKRWMVLIGCMVVVLGLSLGADDARVSGPLGWSAEAGCTLKTEELHYYITTGGGPVWLANAHLPPDGSGAARCAQASGELMNGTPACAAMAVHRLAVCEGR